MTLVLAAGTGDCAFLLGSSPAPSPGALGEGGPTSHLPLGSRGTNQAPCSSFTKISVTKWPICFLLPSPRLLHVVSYVHTGNTSSSTHHVLASHSPLTPSTTGPSIYWKTFSWDKDRLNAD